MVLLKNYVSMILQLASVMLLGPRMDNVKLLVTNALVKRTFLDQSVTDVLQASTYFPTV